MTVDRTHAVGRGQPRHLSDPHRQRPGDRHSVLGASALLVDEAGDLWLGTPDGLHRKRRGKPALEPLWPQQAPSTDASCCDVIALALAADGAIWLSVRRGNVWRYSPLAGNASAIPTSPWVDGMLAESSIAQRMIDRSNLLWLGGYARCGDHAGRWHAVPCSIRHGSGA